MLRLTSPLPVLAYLLGITIAAVAVSAAEVFLILIGIEWGMLCHADSHSCPAYVGFPFSLVFLTAAFVLNIFLARKAFLVVLDKPAATVMGAILAAVVTVMGYLLIVGWQLTG